LSLATGFLHPTADSVSENKKKCKVGLPDRTATGSGYGNRLRCFVRRRFFRYRIPGRMVLARLLLRK